MAQVIEKDHVDITLYQKECNKNLYIPPFSFHHQPAFRSFIYPELQRLRLDCSNCLHFYNNEKKFYNHHLSGRSYSTILLDKLFSPTTPRNELYLNHKIK